MAAKILQVAEIFRHYDAAIAEAELSDHSVVRLTWTDAGKISVQRFVTEAGADEQDHVRSARGIVPAHEAAMFARS